MRRNAFTLAEVLITLGIIGVVAAMTMPTLMGSTQEAQYKTALKKGMSSISQGLALGLAQDGYDTSTATAGTETTEGSFRYMLAKNLKVTSTAKPDGYPTGTIKDSSNGVLDSFYTFADGTMLAFKADNVKSCTASAPCPAIFDTNAGKQPNKLADSAAPYKCSSEVKAALTNPSANAGKQLYTCAKANVGKLPDAYQVWIYDSSIVPATAQGGYIMAGKS